MSKIYVSSTFVDLRAHRKALSLAIRRLGHVDIAMEYYIAEDARPLDRCLRDAGSCDLYVGLFARRYGFCPPGEQRSITELEFRTARAAGIDCLCFLLAEDAPSWPDEYVERGAGADKLTALRAELGTGYLCGLFTTPDELAAIASAAIVRNLDPDPAPFYAQREHRLMKTWQSAKALPRERERARHALVDMASPRYVAAIKERLLAADAEDVAGIAHDLDELQRLASSRRELMPIFLDLLENEDEERRYFATFQLGELALRGVSLSPEIIAALLKRTTDTAPSVRAQMAHTLEKLMSGGRVRADLVAVVERMAKDDSAEVREQAEASLAKLK